MATLARLKLSEAELESLQKDVSSILTYVGQVSAVSTDATGPEVPLHHNTMRKDEPRDPQDPLAEKEESIRAQFPTREGDFNAVRKILQKDE